MSKSTAPSVLLFFHFSFEKLTVEIVIASIMIFELLAEMFKLLGVVFGSGIVWFHTACYLRKV